MVNFKVRAPNDAHLALAGSPNDAEPIIEVFLGGWGNTKSVIRRNKTKPEKAENATPNILNAGEYRGFWIRVQDGVITVGNEGEVAAFLSWQDPEPFYVNFVGVCTGWGASGSWIIEGRRSSLLLAACKIASDLLSRPGARMHANRNCLRLLDAPSAQVGWNPGAHLSQSTGGTPCWIPASNGHLPEGAVQGGVDGEPLYVARARHEGNDDGPDCSLARLLAMHSLIALFISRQVLCCRANLFLRIKWRTLHTAAVNIRMKITKCCVVAIRSGFRLLAMPFRQRLCRPERPKAANHCSLGVCIMRVPLRRAKFR